MPQQCVWCFAACLWCSSGPGVPMAARGTVPVGNKMFALASMDGLGEPPIAQPVSTLYTIHWYLSACMSLHSLHPSFPPQGRVLPVSRGPTRLTPLTRPTRRSSAPMRAYATELPAPASASLDSQGMLVSEVSLPFLCLWPSFPLPLCWCIEVVISAVRYISTYRSLSQRLLRTWDMQLHWGRVILSGTRIRLHCHLSAQWRWVRTHLYELGQRGHPSM